MNQSQDKETKLVIDEDWKSRVEREKQEAAQRARQQSSLGSQEAAGGAAAQSARGELPLPEASLPLLVNLLATQALVSLGLVPGPDGKSAPVDLRLAQHYIDLIEVLEEKTKGNVTTEEANLLTQTLYQLRLAFVDTTKRVREKKSE